MSIHDHPPLVTVKSVHDDGPLAPHTGEVNGRAVHLDLGDQIVTTSNTDLAPLAKAILNAVEPEALVENQKDAEPEPHKSGDWFKVADNAPYNDYFRGQTLQVSETNLYSEGSNWLTLRSEIGDGTVGTHWVTPASEPTPEQQYDVPALVASVANLEDQVAALEAAADPEIRVGDRVYVRADQWNISDVESGYGTVARMDTTGDPAYGKYLVSREGIDRDGLGIWALEVTRG